MRYNYSISSAMQPSATQQMLRVALPVTAHHDTRPQSRLLFFKEFFHLFHSPDLLFLDITMMCKFVKHSDITVSAVSDPYKVDQL